MADANSEMNVQRDWDFSVNLSGLQAPTGKGGNMLPTGFYKVKLMDLYVNPDRNPNRVIIKVQVSEGPFSGAIRTTGFNRPTSNDDKVRYYWRGLAESAGYTPAQLDAGEVNLGINTFKDRMPSSSTPTRKNPRAATRTWTSFPDGVDPAEAELRHERVLSSGEVRQHWCSGSGSVRLGARCPRPCPQNRVPHVSRRKQPGWWRHDEQEQAPVPVGHELRHLRDKVPVNVDQTARG